MAHAPATNSMQRFPLPKGSRYHYASSWSAKHQGCDVFAPEGTPVVAPEPGVAWSAVEPKGGKVVYLEGESGWRYFFGHLKRWHALLDGGVRARVAAGAPLGEVGSTGNAKGKSPHVHVQLRKGSLLVDPCTELARVDPERSGLFGSWTLPVLLLLAAWAYSSCAPVPADSPASRLPAGGGPPFAGAVRGAVWGVTPAAPARGGTRGAG